MLELQEDKALNVLCAEVVRQGRGPHGEGRKALADPPVHAEVGMQLSHTSSLERQDTPFRLSAESCLWVWLGPGPFKRTLTKRLPWDKAHLMMDLTRIKSPTFRHYKQSIMGNPNKKFVIFLTPPHPPLSFIL